MWTAGKKIVENTGLRGGVTDGYEYFMPDKFRLEAGNGCVRAGGGRAEGDDADIMAPVEDTPQDEGLRIPGRLCRPVRAPDKLANRVWLDPEGGADAALAVPLFCRSSFCPPHRKDKSRQALGL